MALPQASTTRIPLCLKFKVRGVTAHDIVLISPNLPSTYGDLAMAASQSINRAKKNDKDYRSTMKIKLEWTRYTETRLMNGFPDDTLITPENIHAVLQLYLLRNGMDTVLIDH
jgi:hypothetical protein